VDEYNVPITHSWIFDYEKETIYEIGNYIFIAKYLQPKMYFGNYSLIVHLSDSKTKEKFDYLESVCNFKVEMMKTTRSQYKWQKNACKYIEDVNWTIINKS